MTASYIPSNESRTGFGWLWRFPRFLATDTWLPGLRCGLEPMGLIGGPLEYARSIVQVDWLTGHLCNKSVILDC